MSKTSVASPRTNIELAITGMTCASCAMRVEKRLNKLDGVSATVNYATEKATVTVPSGYDARALIDAVHEIGYTAALPQPPAHPTPSTPAETEADDP
jgi:P-type Cu+ transporter